MKNTKKIITLALCTILVTQCFCGCKGKKKEVAKTETDTVSQADISSIATRIYELLAIFMVFKVTFSSCKAIIS